MIDLDKCIKKGLIRRITPSNEKAIQSLKKAEELLKEAKGNLREGRYNTVVIVSYLSIFNAARSLLFKDGYREKSHACVARYLEEKYSEGIPKDMIRMLDGCRTSRHSTQYDVGYYPSEEEARELIKFSEEFMEKIRQIIH
ncbi:MAG: HEPN domain-containing protein [Candidatus Altiarchaeota archaeon]|nr:HEPN domain-containing protein [Candidatus Altiarchaeota archaeon]